MVFSGVAMIVVGVWLAAQAIGGNLAGRIRSWANAQITGTGSEGGRITGGGTRTGGGGGARGGGGGTQK